MHKLRNDAFVSQRQGAIRQHGVLGHDNMFTDLVFDGDAYDIAPY